MSADNIQVKDGLGNEFTLRSKDISSAGDGSFQRSMILATPYPLDVVGAFQVAAKSGSMGAGLAANSPVYSFINPSSNLIVVRRVKIRAWSLGTGFTAGAAAFDMYAARSFTVADSGGSAIAFTGNDTKLRTGLASSQAGIHVATTGTLTAGTRVLDPAPIESVSTVCGTSTYAQFANDKLFEKLAGDYPLVLAQNEGFVIEATVPATGIWAFVATAEWDEVATQTF